MISFEQLKKALKLSKYINQYQYPKLNFTGRFKLSVIFFWTRKNRQYVLLSRWIIKKQIKIETAIKSQFEATNVINDVHENQLFDVILECFNFCGLFLLGKIID